ncbi:hypothetical protein HUJ05_008821 [Dendroctonus ponderosae]|nr:hypothetical protein HUJ05_008821 [Dendroctonus ponderosae]
MENNDILQGAALAFAVPQKLVGSEKCTRGPGYWCKDRQTAEECKQQKQGGSERCTRGPSYWCKDKQTAEECKAVHHCETKVWNKNEFRY